MAKRKKRRTYIDPFRSFVAAISYYVAARVLHGDKANRHHVYRPAVAIEAFCLELFIKALLRVRRRYGTSGHHIHYLFRELGTKDQRQIEKRFNHIIGRHPLYVAWKADGLLMDLRSVLERSQTMFSKGRYWHERNALSTDSQGTASNAGVLTLCEAVRDQIALARPQWLGAVEPFARRFFKMQSLPT